MSKRQLQLARIAAFVLVIAISVLVYSFRDRAEQLAIYGYPGIFFLSALSYATVLLPAPGIAVVFTMGTIFHPVGVAFAAGTGAALGELSGYLAGFSGQAVIERIDIYNRLTDWMKRYGPLTILVLSAIPNPFFDIAGVIAGSLRLKLSTFLIYCWLGEMIKMLIFAYLGFRLFDLFNF
jgi:membrane protein YqaA with SNARE-associated domain